MKPAVESSPVEIELTNVMPGVIDLREELHHHSEVQSFQHFISFCKETTTNYKQYLRKSPTFILVQAISNLKLRFGNQEDDDMVLYRCVECMS